MTTDNTSLYQDIREILAENIPSIDAGLPDDADILSMGTDSVSMLMIITEIENRYSITISAEEIPYDQLRTVSGIVSFVASKLNAPIKDLSSSL